MRKVARPVGEGPDGVGDAPGTEVVASPAAQTAGDVADTHLTLRTPLSGVPLDGVHPGLHISNGRVPGTSTADSAEAELGPQWSSSQATQRHEVIMETQPLLLPTPAAIAAVRAVLSTLTTRDDAVGAAKSLLFNTLLLFGRERAIRADKSSASQVEPSENKF